MGGGGYDIWRVVPRAWARIWLEMKGIDPGDDIPQDWIAKWQKQCPVTLPSSWSDPADLYPPIPRKPEITEKMHKPSAKHYMRYDLSSSKEQNKKRPLRRGRFYFLMTISTRRFSFMCSFVLLSFTGFVSA